MNNQDLLLKTIFACMACDGDIAPEEVQVLREFIADTDLFNELDVEVILKKYVDSINQDGVAFLNDYLSDIAENALSKEEQMRLVDLAFKTIEADKRIEYSEVKFFKKIRVRLTLTDEEILAKYPDKEDFLLPDINVADDPEWNNVTFAEIPLSQNKEPKISKSNIVILSVIAYLIIEIGIDNYCCPLKIFVALSYN